MAVKSQRGGGGWGCLGVFGVGGVSADRQETQLWS